MSNRAWVTLATNDSYGLGALVLAHSLRRSVSTYPTVVLITPSVTDAMRDRLSAVFTEVISVDVLDSRDATHLALLQRPELGITFTKIHCWSLTQYEKCVFLDADTLVVQNCDELFEREELSAAPDVGWPDCFNSGVFVFKPSADTYSRLISFAQERGSFDGGDQGLLNSFFSDWAHGDISKHLPFLYNVTSAAFYSYLPALKHFGQNLKIIHFIGAAKPWLQQFNWETRTVDAPEHVRGLLQLWWDLFVGQVHSQLNVTMDASATVEEEEEEAPPQLPPQDVQVHYAPKLDPESEFPWHHPEAQAKLVETQPQIDESQFYDPWKYHRGNIPPMKDSSDFGGTQDLRQLRQYAWDYQSSHRNYVPETNEQNIWHQPQQHYNQHQTQSHYQTHSEHTQHHWEQHSHHEHSQSQQGWHQHHQSHQHYSHDHSEPSHEHSSSTDHHYQQNDHHQQHEQPQQTHDHHHARDPSHNHHHDDHSIHSQHRPLHHSDSEKQEPHSSFAYSHLHHERNDIHYHDEKHVESHFVPVDHSQKSYEHRLHHQDNEYTRLEHHAGPPKPVQHIYQVHLDHRRRNQRHHRVKISIISCPDKMINGEVSETESEDSDYIIPRHPYDGFYLRHKSTIDPRGHKICSHEIPPIPSPCPPSESPTLSASTSTEDFLSASECEDQTGVAGNLARVVPGSIGYQREALDELTRRQGWEAGNIDYMGADSFENIWAKISQTLSQPKQPSPPRKEPSPPKQTEVKEVAAPATEETPVPAPVTAVEAPAPVVEAPAPVAASAPVEAPAPVEVPAPAAAPAPAVAPVPAEAPAPTAAPASVEAPAPVAAPAPVGAPAPVAAPAPVEAPAQVEAPAPVAAPAPVEASAPVEAPAPAAAPAPVEAPAPVSAPAPVEAPAPAAASAPVEAPAPVAAPVSEAPAPVSVAPVTAAAPEAPKEKKPEPVVPPTPPATPKSASEDSSPTTPLSPVESPKVAPAAEVPASPAAAEPPKFEATPEKSLEKSTATAASTDSPPLANTPSKEEAPTVPAAKSEERRKPAGKLQLSPPAAADPLPTPDSELEDAASLAQSIIASELSTSVTSPSPSADVTSPPPLEEKRLSVEKPEVPTPPVSLAQIGVKPKAKATTAAQIESSVSEKAEPSTPTTPESPSEPSTPTDAPKKKGAKKAAKKEGGSSGDAATPVPPPRKKEKKPKEK